MGYTNYWHRPKEIDCNIFNKIVDDFKKYCSYEGSCCVDMVINNSKISFDGESESFIFKRLDNDLSIGCEDGLYFDCCKTRQGYYDKYVKAVLLIAYSYMGDDFEIDCDGPYSDWHKVRKELESVLKRNF